MFGSFNTPEGSSIGVLPFTGYGNTPRDAAIDAAEKIAAFIRLYQAELVVFTMSESSLHSAGRTLADITGSKWPCAHTYTILATKKNGAILS